MGAGAVSLHNVDIGKYVQHIDPQHRIFLHERKPTKQENFREIRSTVTGLVNGLHTKNFVELSEIVKNKIRFREIWMLKRFTEIFSAKILVLPERLFGRISPKLYFQMHSQKSFLFQ